ncbi:MAG: hypothetical protein JW741_11980 [Sedimentisphaerales bacterium]|nr:hypothetical protein [Sedimentisphaerales bacterium]
MSRKSQNTTDPAVNLRDLALAAAREVFQFSLAAGSPAPRSGETENAWSNRVDLQGRFKRIKAIIRDLEAGLSDGIITGIERARRIDELTDSIRAAGAPTTTYHTAALQQAKGFLAMCVSASSYFELRQGARTFPYMPLEDLLAGIRNEYAMLHATHALDREDCILLEAMVQAPVKLFTLDMLGELMDRNTAQEHVNSMIRRGLVHRPGTGKKGCQATPLGKKAFQLTKP